MCGGHPSFFQNRPPCAADCRTVWPGRRCPLARAEWESCRLAAGEEWDDSEAYPIVQELRAQLPDLRFTRCSACAGVLTLPG